MYMSIDNNWMCNMLKLFQTSQQIREGENEPIYLIQGRSRLKKVMKATEPEQDRVQLD